MSGLELLTNSEMAEADRLAPTYGVTGMTLMENAGQAVADVAEHMAAGAPITILCGPGNNGGDGFVAARLLQERGHDVRLALFGSPDNLKGDAARMAALWSGDTRPWSTEVLEGAGLVVDAIFGAGLARPLPKEVSSVTGAMNARRLPVLAVDVPTGLDGTSGQVFDGAVRAHETVTFFRRKPAHLLEPGRSHCGRVTLADIGMPSEVLEAIRPRAFANAPGLWQGQYPRPQSGGHKYTRGHTVVVSGPAHATGAARLGARAALRVGAGLVTIASPLDAVAVNAAHLTAIMLQPIAMPKGLADVLVDTRRNTVLIGPGTGVSDATRQMVEIALASRAGIVLDADALTSFSDFRAPLFSRIRNRDGCATVLTPHEGEFARLFGAPERTISKLERARNAAALSGAILVLKGPDTIIASPDGRAAINENAPPFLATAGSGDVLAGFIAGLLAQKMPPFEAACASVWLHGECANAFGPGLISEDLPEILPEVLKRVVPQWQRTT